MELYSKFIGIDIGKFNFVVNCHGQKHSKTSDNTPLGIREFLGEYRARLKKAFCVLEATGVYEMHLLLVLCNQGLCVHRAHARKVKNFIRSYGNEAKTDHLDAKVLSLYASERFEQLELFKPQSEQALALYELVQRRRDLKQMLVAEKNRQQAPLAKVVKDSHTRIIAVLTEQLEEVNQLIERIITEDSSLKRKQAILVTVPGIGKKVAAELLAMMPELGHMNRRQAASLAGVAPRANETGRFKGYRRVAPGRNHVKPMLFLSAMAARNSNSSLKAFYLQLTDRGKSKMVALVALMRKIIVIANARLKEEMLTT